MLSPMRRCGHLVRDPIPEESQTAGWAGSDAPGDADVTNGGNTHLPIRESRPEGLARPKNGYFSGIPCKNAPDPKTIRRPNVPCLHRRSPQPIRGGGPEKHICFYMRSGGNSPGSSNYKDKSWFAALTRLVLYVMRFFAWALVDARRQACHQLKYLRR